MSVINVRYRTFRICKEHSMFSFDRTHIYIYIYRCDYIYIHIYIYVCLGHILEPGSELTPDKAEDEWTSSEALRKDMAWSVM